MTWIYIVTQLLLSCAIDQAIFMLHRANKAFDYLPSKRIKTESNSEFGPVSGL